MAHIDIQRPTSWDLTKRNACVNLVKLLLTAVQGAVFWGLLLRPYLEGLSGGQSLISVVIYLLLYVLMCLVYDAFDVDQSSRGEAAYSLSLALVFALFFQYLILCLTTDRILNPSKFLVVLVFGVVLNVIGAAAMVRVYRSLFPALCTYVIYDDPDGLKERPPLDQLRWKFRIQSCLDLKLGVESVLEQIADAQAVILVDVHSSERNKILKYCIEAGIQTYIRPKIGDLLLQGGSQLQLLNVPVIHCGRFHKNMTYLVLKRAMDIVLSGMAVVVLSPVMIVVALLIRFYDGGPAIYRQVRLTKDGRTFDILKFRSMRVDAEKDGVARLASEGDDRITPVGRVIRATRIDELPQLFNILKGEMSIVGPRPERPEIAAEYEQEMPEFVLRLQAKAGLTGYAQVYGKYNTRPYDKLQMDLMYIAKQSVLMDLKLMFITVKVLFMKESTEGVDEGQVTAGKH